MYRILFTCIVLSFNLINGQKLLKKSIVNPHTKLIQIEGNNCFKVDLETSKTDEIVVEATIDGEYTKDLLLKIKEVGTTLIVSAGFQPNFVHPNDKLSAHKVLSISLAIKVPEFMEVQVYGTTSNVMVSGKYRHLEVVLQEGRCTLKEVSEKVMVRTQSGDIIVFSSKAAITAATKYGELQREMIPNGDNQIGITSITGDISIKKTE